MSTLTFTTRRQTIRARRRAAALVAIVALTALVLYSLLASSTSAQQTKTRAAKPTAVHTYVTRDGSQVVTGFSGGAAIAP